MSARTVTVAHEIALAPPGPLAEDLHHVGGQLIEIAEDGHDISPEAEEAILAALDGRVTVCYRCRRVVRGGQAAGPWPGERVPGVEVSHGLCGGCLPVERERVGLVWGAHA